jgi:hypothetical protein
MQLLAAALSHDQALSGCPSWDAVEYVRGCAVSATGGALCLAAAIGSGGAAVQTSVSVATEQACCCLHRTTLICVLRWRRAGACARSACAQILGSWKELTLLGRLLSRPHPTPRSQHPSIRKATAYKRGWSGCSPYPGAEHEPSAATRASVMSL